jgi:hypothetical protein
MTLPSYNVNHPARWRELERRGASCGAPTDVARAQQGADAIYNNAIQSAIPPAPPPPKPVVCTKTGNVMVCN